MMDRWNKDNFVLRPETQEVRPRDGAARFSKSYHYCVRLCYTDIYGEEREYLIQVWHRYVISRVQTSDFPLIENVYLPGKCDVTHLPSYFLFRNRYRIEFVRSFACRETRSLARYIFYAVRLRPWMRANNKWFFLLVGPVVAEEHDIYDVIYDIDVVFLGSGTYMQRLSLFMQICEQYEDV